MPQSLLKCSASTVVSPVFHAGHAKRFHSFAVWMLMPDEVSPGVVHATMSQVHKKNTEA